MLRDPRAAAGPFLGLLWAAARTLAGRSLPGGVDAMEPGPGWALGWWAMGEGTFAADPGLVGQWGAVASRCAWLSSVRPMARGGWLCPAICADRA